MDNTLIKFMFMAISSFVLVLGLTLFFSLYSSFFNIKISANDFEFEESDEVLDKIYSKADIYYDYNQYSNDENIEGLLSDNYGKVDIFIDEKKVDYNMLEEDIIRMIDLFSAEEFFKEFIYKEGKLKSIRYKSR